MLYFFTQSGVVTQEWKDQFIGNFIPVAGAWSGGNVALQYKISGFSVLSRGVLFSLYDTGRFVSPLQGQSEGP